MDKLAHVVVGMALSLTLGVSGFGSRMMTPVVLGVAIGREWAQRPRNDGREQMRDVGYTVAGGLIGGALWFRHHRGDEAVQRAVLDAMFEDLRRERVKQDSLALHRYRLRIGGVE